jgi:hypothetical protein
MVEVIMEPRSDPGAALSREGDFGHYGEQDNLRRLGRDAAIRKLDRAVWSGRIEVPAGWLGGIGNPWRTYS